MSASVLVVVVAWNSGEHLQRCLDALERQTYRDFEVVVWDNASPDGPPVLDLPENARLVLHPENLGFAAGNNRAAALGRGRWIAALNPDAFAEPQWLEELVAAGERCDAVAVGSVQLMDDDPTRLDGLGDVYSLTGHAWRGGYRQAFDPAAVKEGEISAPCGAAALYRRDAFEAVGGFDERYFCYFEDVDLGLRLRARGGRIVLAPKAVVRHVASASTRTVSGFAEYHGARNRIWTFAKTMPGGLLPLALPLHVAATGLLLLKALGSGHFMPRWRGMGDGLRGLGPFLRERPAWRPVDGPNLVRRMSLNPLVLPLRPAVVWPLRPAERR